ncbi:hypothetical protein CCHR01_13430 [Colletotrichum chrysophilum]|uniref:Uncharacterized protein n=1 Tax=Colletotrichum chrysophilum TaxID=1836956 RepID=A0AAD9A9Y1_9PEZI|nr:hypothetical protein CCHR01_13430 [Colletotrichum chrysophilum]
MAVENLQTASGFSPAWAMGPALGDGLGMFWNLEAAPPGELPGDRMVMPGSFRVSPTRRPVEEEEQTWKGREGQKGKKIHPRCYVAAGLFLERAALSSVSVTSRGAQLGKIRETAVRFWKQILLSASMAAACCRDEDIGTADGPISEDVPASITLDLETAAPPAISKKNCPFAVSIDMATKTGHLAFSWAPIPTRYTTPRGGIAHRAMYLGASSGPRTLSCKDLSSVETETAPQTFDSISWET